ncbi:hypothetical protein IPM19_01950 [bacterium]|nr:MAG: hypothetical protein IPM19_01950 [bacterium]
MAKKKFDKAKTKAETEGLELAVFLASNFRALEYVDVNLEPKTTVGKKIQNYLDRHSARKHENILHGIVCVRDVFKNSTGGRIHLVAGLEGPIVEAVSSEVIGEPIDYEAKHKYLKKLAELVAESKAPKAGNIHFHLLECSKKRVTPANILQLIRRDHGMQNDLQQIADSKISVLINLPKKPYWRPNVDSAMINHLFSHQPEP